VQAIGVSGENRIVVGDQALTICPFEHRHTEEAAQSGKVGSSLEVETES